MVLVVNNPPIPTSTTPLEQRFETGSGLSLPLASLFSDLDQGDAFTVVATVSRLQQQADGSWQEQGQPFEAPWLTIAHAPAGVASRAALSRSATSSAAVLTINPGRDEAGRYRLHLQATDLLGASSNLTMDLEVVAANAAPQVTRQLGADPQRRQQRS